MKCDNQTDGHTGERKATLHHRASKYIKRIVPTHTKMFSKVLCALNYYYIIEKTSFRGSCNFCIIRMVYLEEDEIITYSCINQTSQLVSSVPDSFYKIRVIVFVFTYIIICYTAVSKFNTYWNLYGTVLELLQTKCIQQEYYNIFFYLSEINQSILLVLDHAMFYTQVCSKKQTCTCYSGSK